MNAHWAAGLPPVPAVDRAEMADELDGYASQWDAGTGVADLAYLRLHWPTGHMEGPQGFDCARLVLAAAADVLGQRPGRGVMVDVFTRGDGPAVLRRVAQRLRVRADIDKEQG